MCARLYGVSVSGNANRDSATRIVDPDADRDRGVLTPHDRSFLLAEPGKGVRAEMSETAVRQKRHKIRNRFRNALVDIQYLLLLEDADLGGLFPADKWDADELGIVHGAVLAAVYHMIRAESEREEVTNILAEIIANDVIREYAEKHGVYAPLHGMKFNFPAPEDCESLDELRAKLGDGEELPEKAHMALDYGGMHPNPEEHL
jgi:hypothetical protein